MKNPFFLPLALWMLLPCLTATANDELFFERDVRPILKARCFQCHGEDGAREGELDVRLRRFLVAGGESGAAIVPGDAEGSLLFRRVSNGEMPPDDKVLSVQEQATLGRWIEQGARTRRDEPAELGEGPQFTEEERNFWAFQPLQYPSVELPHRREALQSPIDAFVQRQLESQSLAPSEQAERPVLIRRLYYDLLGLPPEPEAVARFVADPAPNAYERLVDRLLASPQYGERWGRHWLDVAGYADSEGYVDADPVRNWAYSYRDYVIQAMNSDMPLDQFVVEQLAGDELVPQPHVNLSDGQVRRLTATGFLRMAPDGTAAGGIDQEVARNEVVADTINIVSTSLLGLTVGCARCHDHRYDPISQKDYYQFRAIFEPALDWKSWRTSDARRISLYNEQDRQVAASIETRAKEAEAKRLEIQAGHLARTLDEELIKAPDELKESLRAAFNTPPGERSEQQTALLKKFPNIQNISAGSLYLYSEQRARRADEIAAVADEKQRQFLEQVRTAHLASLDEALRLQLEQILAMESAQRSAEQLQLLADHPAVGVTLETLQEFDAPGAALVEQYRNAATACRSTDAKQQLAELQQGIDAIRATIPIEHFIRALTEPPNHVPQTVLFRRGNHTQPADTVEPAELTILAEVAPVEIPLNDESRETSGRRLAYARHLTGPDHPLLSRVLVNRVWLHHFGQGLVRSAGDFGRLGEPPTHPELLDWLAQDVMASGWQVKRLHRRILTSHTYRQRSARTEVLDHLDPDNRLLARQSLRRVESEALRDSILSVSGVLNTQMFGPPIPVREDEVGQIVIGNEDLDGERKPKASGGLGASEHRRSIYIQVRRSRPLAVLESFDLATVSPNCTQRSASNVAPQALLLMNSQFIAEYADCFAERLIHEVGDDITAQLQRAWEVTSIEPATQEQLERLSRFVGEQADTLRRRDEKLDLAASHRLAVAMACQALLATNSFLYID